MPRRGNEHRSLWFWDECMLDDVVKTRLKIGLSLLAAICGLLYLDHWSNRALCIGLLVPLLFFFGLREFAILAKAAGLNVAVNRMSFFGAFLACLPVLNYELGFSGILEWEGAFFVLYFLALVFPALSDQPSKALLGGLAGSVFGVIYIWFLGSYALRLRYMEGPGIGEAALFYTIFVAKGTDIFAFFAGKYLGKTKFIPHISPGKTFVGFIGGMVGAVLITAAFCAWTPLGLLLPWRYMLPFAIVVGLVVVAGDLVESLIKRSAAIKDSANLLPTFGGILDVIDSILTAAPVVYYGLKGIESLRVHF
ncbi:MAG: phosphatidate cytidylyltransferase [Planctomycetota bacterium]|nr:phosphatidate cytidylyltransferase [Planctomycetota bacterium]